MDRKVSKNVTGILYAFIHFSVEATCFYMLSNVMNGFGYVWILALVYDALAFVPQTIFGSFSDKHPNYNLGAIGAVAVIAALFIPDKTLAVIIIATGNALVHISGAQATLRGSDGKSTPAAVFVGAGSIGVMTGKLIAKYSAIYVIAIVTVLMLISFIIMLMLPRYSIPFCTCAYGFKVNNKLSVRRVVLLMFITVVARSYLSYAIPLSWMKSMWQTVLLFVAMGAGKMLGGIVSDIIGVRKTAIISLCIALPLMITGDKLMTVSLIGVTFFSMTMPLTLSTLVAAMPHKPGTAFGITTLGLFTGTLPIFFVKIENLFANIAIVTVLTLLALYSFIICLKEGNENNV